MVRLRIPAEVPRLNELCAFVRAGAEAGGMSAEEINRLDLVLEELFVNVARYAYAPDVEGTVEVGYTVEGPGRLLVEMADSGRQFNPLDSDPPDFSRGLADRPTGGLGIYLVKSLAHSIRYEWDGAINRISFVFSGDVKQRTSADRP